MSTEPDKFDAEKYTAKYLKLRAKIKEIEARHGEELKPYKEAKDKLEGMLLEHLNGINAKSVRTTAGTPYIRREVTATIADKIAFWNWMLATDNFDYLDIRASKTAIIEYMKEQARLAKSDPNITPTPPPGINYSVGQRLGCVKSK